MPPKNPNAEITAYQFYSNLCKMPCIERIVLFGSRARGDHRARSDIDLGVDAPTATTDEWLNILELIDNADTLLKIDCIRLDTLTKDSAFYAAILREGVLLYEKNIQS